jgi:hypothetical protein
VLGGGLLVCVTMLATACTGSSGSPAASGSSAPAATADPAPSPTLAGSSPVVPSHSGGSSPTRAGASSPPPAVSVAGGWYGYGPCPDLEVQLGLAQGTTNTTYQVIDFTNRGQVGCILAGYPGVNLAGGTPVAPIGLPAAHSGPSTVREITLQPGGVANALLQITNARGYVSTTCGPVQARYLLIDRPDGAAPVKLAYTTTACSRAVQMMQVSAVSLGTGG